MTTETRPRLSRDDWTAEALRALTESGLTAVAIEPLALRLGATKGSGYWHFANRAALVEATLLRWEREHTEQVIAVTKRTGDPMLSIRELFIMSMHSDGPQSTELALLAAAADPLVGAALRRVTERRTAYLAELFAEAGFAAEPARQRALLAYTSYLGHAHLARIAPDQLFTGADLERYLDATLASLLDGSTDAPTERPPGSTAGGG